MSAHLSNELIEQFHRQALTGGDRGEIYNHILRCETCRQRVVTPQIEAVALRTLTGHLLPTEDEEPFHLELETIEAFVDDTLDPLDRSTVKLHLEDCAQCAAEVSDLRESLATMNAASRRRPESLRAEIRPSQSLKFSMPMRIAAMVALIAFAALALIAVFRWRSSSPSIMTSSQPTPLGSPQAPALTPSPSTGGNPPKLAENPPTKEPSEQPRNVIALKDGPNEIVLDQGGNVVGLSSLPAETREAAREALTEERLNRPSVLDDVRSAEVSVRGPGSEERISILLDALENSRSLSG
jgi:Putative zinc-finger